MTTTTTDDQPDDARTPEQKAIWAPAEQNLPDALVHDLMFMNRITDVSPPVHQYKHSLTRRYINLDHFGQTYRVEVRTTEETAATPDGYAMDLTRIPFTEALAELGIRDRGDF